MGFVFGKYLVPFISRSLFLSFKILPLVCKFRRLTLEILTTFFTYVSKVSDKTLIIQNKLPFFGMLVMSYFLSHWLSHWLQHEDVGKAGYIRSCMFHDGWNGGLQRSCRLMVGWVGIACSQASWASWMVNVEVVGHISWWMWCWTIVEQKYDKASLHLSWALFHVCTAHSARPLEAGWYGANVICQIPLRCINSSHWMVWGQRHMPNSIVLHKLKSLGCMGPTWYPKFHCAV